MRRVTEEEVQTCLDILINEYRLPMRLLIRLIGKERLDNIQGMLRELSGQSLTDRKMAELIIREKGELLFAGSEIAVRELRSHLLKQLDDEQLTALYERNPDTKKMITAPKYMITPLVKKKWLVGGRWPKDFVRTLGFPTIFAGKSAHLQVRKEAYVDVEPKRTVPPLVPFQEELKNDLLEVLKLEGNHTRCVVTMPTGTGKTRVAVESYIEWMREGFAKGRYLIWVAQSEELCEQAIACVSEMWQEKEYPESLRLYRYFSGNQIDEDALEGGAVVASIQQLFYRIKNGDPVLVEILRDCGAMIIDEAHHAVAPMYRLLLEKAEEFSEGRLFPICGLTATPGRNDEQTMKLVNKFEAHLVQPKIKLEAHDTPLRFFREQGYLAKPKHVIYQSGKVFEVDELHIAADGELDFTELLRVLAADVGRNKQIVQALAELPETARVLIYACTVEHAEFLAQTMNVLGFSAVAITSHTPKSTRRMYIDQFKKGQIKYLFNYGVLTTGFDAPKTDYIIITRPTTSVIFNDW